MNILLRGYSDEDFLAEKLKKVFMLIEAEKDRFLHNDMIDDVMNIVGFENGEELRKSIARLIIQLGVKHDAQRKTEKEKRRQETD